MAWDKEVREEISKRYSNPPTVNIGDPPGTVSSGETSDISKAIDKTIDHPDYYGGANNPYEAIKVIEAWNLDFNLGNTVKYIARCGKKVVAATGDNPLQDLKKAQWYLNREITNLERIK